MQERIDQAGATVAFAAAAAAGARVRREDFLPRWDRAHRERQDPERMIAFMRSLQERGRRRGGG